MGGLGRIIVHITIANLSYANAINIFYLFKILIYNSINY
jgi:hypothetical protein